MKEFQVIKYKNTNAATDLKEYDFKLIGINLYWEPDDQPIEKYKLLKTMHDYITGKSSKDLEKMKSLISQGLSSFYVQTLKSKKRNYLAKIGIKEKFNFLKTWNEGVLCIENSDCQNILHFAVFYENIKCNNFILF